MDRKGGGCALLVGVAFLIGLVMWALAIALVILAGVVALGGIIVGGGIVAHAVSEVKRAREVDGIGETVAQMSVESERDLLATLVDLDELIRTRGVGTSSEGTFYTNPAALRTERRRLETMLTRLSVAPDTPSRLAAVVSAETLRVKVNAVLDGDS
ncbi:hypothetical protein [Corynebacterium sanguinis]|uniref:hypothetical protein n=1 Tax=Corynebacterium sanguinis TaxID=2594913 RepID=UPI00264E3B22|nr:hypothetical protein [Corynebacterium sanguinis]MDN8576926.1 hypothetical protein [Corynebacterium sanguinis]